MSAFHPPLRPTPPTSHPAIAARTVTPLHAQAVTPSPLGFPLSPEETTARVRLALQEDEAFNDVSTIATVVSTRQVRSTIVARRDAVIAGIPLAVEAFRLLDDAITLRVNTEDGARVRAGEAVLTITGHARGILSAERTALNFLQLLSGIATLTRRFVDAVAGTTAQIVDTRNTTPGWRTLETYAVRAGGGANHRLDLRSGVLITGNHLAASGGDIAAAVARARQTAPPGIPVHVECDTIAQVDAAVAAGADGVRLDTMSLDQLREAVPRCVGRVVTEACGGVTLDTVRAIADTGVDRIAVGALTHSAPALDLSLDEDVR